MPIKVKLYELNKRQVDLLDELRKRGYKTLQQPELSLVVNNRLTTPKGTAIREECFRIIDEWEKGAD